jgi:hypothetical protein
LFVGLFCLYGLCTDYINFIHNLIFDCCFGTDGCTGSLGIGVGMIAGVQMSINERLQKFYQVVAQIILVLAILQHQLRGDVV